MSRIEDSRAWLALAADPIADASVAIIKALARTDAPPLTVKSYIEDVISSLDKARVHAMRALVYVEMAKDEADAEWSASLDAKDDRP